MPSTDSYTPQPAEDEDVIRDHVRYCANRGWAIIIEYTDDPSPINHYWHRWGLPTLDPEEPDTVLVEIDACRKRFPECHIRLLAYAADEAHSRIRHTLLVCAP